MKHQPQLLAKDYCTGNTRLASCRPPASNSFGGGGRAGCTTGTCTAAAQNCQSGMERRCDDTYRACRSPRPHCTRVLVICIVPPPKKKNYNARQTDGVGGLAIARPLGPAIRREEPSILENQGVGSTFQKAETKSQNLATTSNTVAFSQFTDIIMGSLVFFLVRHVSQSM